MKFKWPCDSDNPWYYFGTAAIGGLLLVGLLIASAAWLRGDGSQITAEEYRLNGDFHIDVHGEEGPTLAEVVDRLRALQNTIAACCGTETRDPQAEKFLSVMVELRKIVEEHDMRLEELEEK